VCLSFGSFAAALINDIVIRILLLPISLLYGLGISVRNLLYRIGALRSVRFDIPVISIGNLSVGGTGKSPHIEYVVRWLSAYIQPGILSRGYGRKTAGLREVTLLDSAHTAGDEPLQFKQKFPEVPIFVSESRALGVPGLLKDYPQTQCVLLDDAFQHLAVTPGLNILLTEYSRPFYRDWLLPSGRLREWPSAYRRADLIVVTKCPDELTPSQRHKILNDLAAFPRQQVFFSQYHYGHPYYLFEPHHSRLLNRDTELLLVSAIANTDYLLRYLSQQVHAVHTLEFEDHHYFDTGDLWEIQRRFKEIQAAQKFILTTEKDATRLRLHEPFWREQQLPILVLPVEVQFLDDDETKFKATVQEFLLGFKV
jgi:tetraacyldisaccharide 4'-kinase